MISASRIAVDPVIQAGKVVDREQLANWKEGGPLRPEITTGPGPTLMRIPFIHDIMPEAMAVNEKNPPEIIIRGEKYSKDSLVLFNNQLLPAKFYSDTQLGVQIKSSFLKEAGTLPIVVVNPGNGGGASNTNYLIVAAQWPPKRM